VTRRTATRWLWALLFAALPVPFYVGAGGLEPPLGVAFLAALGAGIWWTEGSGGTTASLAALALAQALFWLLATGALAGCLSRALFALLPRRAGWAVGALCAGLALAALFPIYATPLSSQRPRSNWLQLFE
jgi:hypothetical protein